MVGSSVEEEKEAGKWAFEEGKGEGLERLLNDGLVMNHEEFSKM